MRKRDHKAEYERIKADPVRYAKYLERHRLAEKRITKARPGRETNRKRNWRAANPEDAKRIRQASHAVESALKSGRLIRPMRCSECCVRSEFTTIEAHHHKGYAKEHWLDVVWLCTKCHAAEHREPLPGKLKGEGG